MDHEREVRKRRQPLRRRLLGRGAHFIAISQYALYRDPEPDLAGGGRRGRAANRTAIAGRTFLSEAGNMSSELTGVSQESNGLSGQTAKARAATPETNHSLRSYFQLQRSEFWSGDLGLTLVTISVTFLIFVVSPLRESGFSVRIFLDLVVVALMIYGASVIKGGSFFKVCVIVAATVTAIVLIAGRVHPTLFLHLCGSVLVTISLLLYVRVVLVVMFRAGPVTWSRIQGGVCAYLLLGLAWASTFQFLEQFRPGSFHFASAPASLDQMSAKLIYFSFAMLTTVGSDITPVHPFARSLATAEAIVGQLFPAILIGALVAMAMQARPKA